MELNDLVGKHVLSGVDMVTKPNNDNFWNDSCEVINFVLDSVTYTAVEDPEDGYRSCMRDIYVSETEVVNNFPSQEVVGVMRQPSVYNKHDVIDFIDTTTGKIVLSVGTTDIDDYYPGWVAVFTPENMAINNQPSEE